MNFYYVSSISHSHCRHEAKSLIENLTNKQLLWNTIPFKLLQISEFLYKWSWGELMLFWVEYDIKIIVVYSKRWENVDRR